MADAKETGAFFQDLASFDDSFTAAEAPENGEVPDGKYKVRVEDVTLDQAKRSGNLMLKWQLVVTEGPHADRYIFKNNMITEKSLPYLKGDLLRCGMRLAKLSDLEGRLEELLGLELSVQKKAQEGDGDFYNVYFNKLLARPDASKAAASGAGLAKPSGGTAPF